MDFRQTARCAGLLVLLGASCNSGYSIIGNGNNTPKKMVGFGLFVILFALEVIRDKKLFESGKQDKKGLDLVIYFGIPMLTEFFVRFNINEALFFNSSVWAIQVGLIGWALRLWFDPVINRSRNKGFYYLGNRSVWDLFLKKFKPWGQLGIRILLTLLLIAVSYHLHQPWFLFI